MDGCRCYIMLSTLLGHGGCLSLALISLFCSLDFAIQNYKKIILFVFPPSHMQFYHFFIIFQAYSKDHNMVNLSNHRLGKQLFECWVSTKFSTLFLNESLFMYSYLRDCQHTSSNRITI